MHLLDKVAKQFLCRLKEAEEEESPATVRTHPGVKTYQELEKLYPEFAMPENMPRSDETQSGQDFYILTTRDYKLLWKILNVFRYEYAPQYNYSKDMTALLDYLLEKVSVNAGKED